MCDTHSPIYTDQAMVCRECGDVLESRIFDTDIMDLHGLTAKQIKQYQNKERNYQYCNSSSINEFRYFRDIKIALHLHNDVYSILLSTPQSGRDFRNHRMLRFYSDHLHLTDLEKTDILYMTQKYFTNNIVLSFMASVYYVIRKSRPMDIREFLSFVYHQGHHINNHLMNRFYMDNNLKPKIWSALERVPIVIEHIKQSPIFRQKYQRCNPNLSMDQYLTWMRQIMIKLCGQNPVQIQGINPLLYTVASVYASEGIIQLHHHTKRVLSQLTLARIHHVTDTSIRTVFDKYICKIKGVTTRYGQITPQPSNPATVL